jgi:nanoRNase/pAp phosphatase (c-di-AMP/oligoRNAs hydrolase)
MDSADTAKIKDLVEKAKSILVVTHNHPTFDSMGGALATYLGLSSLGKSVTVACAVPMTVEFSNFVGADKMVSSVSKRNFVISLDYQDGAIEKVSYNIEGNKFNLVIEPRPGYTGFSEKNVSYSQSGTGVADLVVAIDVANLGQLGDLYEKNKESFAGKPIVVVDRHADNTRFGTVNAVDERAGTTTELIAVILSSLGVKLTEDIATNILNALYGATDSFRSQTVTPRTFEVASVCLRAGGKRFVPSADRSVTPPPAVKPAPVQPTPPRDGGSGAQAQGQQLPRTEQQPQTDAKPDAQPAPEDWLKPKIFRSSQPLK